MSRRACAIMVVALVVTPARGAGPKAKPAAPSAAAAEPTPDVGDAPPAPAVARAVGEAPANAPMSDADDAARLESLSSMVKAYEAEAHDTRDQIRSLAERKYKERRERIEEGYSRALKPVVEAERQRRVDAIAAFERFLERHPSDKNYTPDALFRLAELYFERYDDEYQQSMRDYREAYAVWNSAGGKGDPPGEPAQHFDRTVALYRKLIGEFPSYRLIDGAYYLLGYTLRAQGNTKEGMDAWTTLVANYPKSRFYPEVWFRIGDQHFDDEKWDAAIAAFSKVVPLKRSSFYDKALYKLAWTYYLVNRFDEAVSRFFELLDYSYAKRGPKGLGGGSELEEESVQYVAISFADDKWDRGAQYKRALKGPKPSDDAENEIRYVAFATDFFSKKGHKPYEREVIARLGDVLFRQSKNVQAVDALQAAIDLDPMHRDAPKLQDQIVQAWVRERQFDKANGARDLLVKNYGNGTQWAKRYANDSEALKAAEELGRTNLYSAALYYHQQAMQYFANNRQDLGVQYFRAASDSYRAYLDRYPHDKNAYELGYYLAETYYYSMRFEDAVKQYELTRDSTAGTKYRGDAGLNALHAYEKVIEQAVRDNKMEKREIFAGAHDKDAVQKQAEEIPPLRAKYVGAIDKFLATSPDHEMAPAFAYRAGEVYYAYNQYDEAVRRFQAVVDKYPQSEAARFAANLILNNLIAKKDWTTAAQYAAKFQKEAVGGQADPEFAKVEGGAKFNIAKETLEKGAKALDEGRITEGTALLESGSDQYLKLIDEDPKRQFADLMMYNAALSLEKARRPARAATLYERLYTEFPNSEFAPEAMFRVATKSEQAFNFDKAIDTYLALVKKYPQSERRADAQINSAIALEGQQKYDKAAQEFERFATMFPDKPEAPDVYYRAALVQKKRGNAPAELATLRGFIGRYGANPKLVPRVMEAQVRIGDIYKEQADGQKDAKRQAETKKQALESYGAAVKNFGRANTSPAAAYFGAKAAFQLADEQFASYALLKIDGRTGKQQGKDLETKSAKLQAVESTFKNIITQYKAAEWSLASLYRIGALYDNLQHSVLNAPCPDDIKKIGGAAACDEYRNLVEDQAIAVEEKAVNAYKVAYDKAAELRLTNEWTKRTLEALNLLRPDEYPIDKEPVTKPARGESHPLGYVLPDGGLKELKAVGGDAKAGGAA